MATQASGSIAMYTIPLVSISSTAPTPSSVQSSTAGPSATLTSAAPHSASNVTTSTGSTSLSEIPSSAALSPESLGLLAKSLPKYLVIGAIVVAILILVGSISWYIKQRRRRARFMDDDDDDDGWASRVTSRGSSRRTSESSEKEGMIKSQSSRSTPTKSPLGSSCSSAAPTPVKHTVQTPRIDQDGRAGETDRSSEASRRSASGHGDGVV